MATLFQTAKFKSANTLFGGKPPNLMTANISGYTVVYRKHDLSVEVLMWYIHCVCVCNAIIRIICIYTCVATRTCELQSAMISGHHPDWSEFVRTPLPRLSEGSMGGGRASSRDLYMQCKLRSSERERERKRERERERGYMCRKWASAHTWVHFSSFTIKFFTFLLLT